MNIKTIINNIIIKQASKKLKIRMTKKNYKNEYEIFSEAIKLAYPHIPINSPTMSYQEASDMLGGKPSKQWFTLNKKYFRLSPNKKLYKLEIEQLKIVLDLKRALVSSGIVEEKRDVRNSQYYAILPMSDYNRGKSENHQSIRLIIEAYNSPLVQYMLNIDKNIN